MHRLVVLGLLAACGGSDHTPDAAGDDDILTQLQALPGVTVAEMPPTRAPTGYRYFVLHVTQPVDHAAPGGATFQQEVSLIHRDRTAPMMAMTSGYDDFIRDRAAEPTRLLQANQISIEHRFFAESRPSPEDWSKLTIKQMADDEHAIIQLLKPIYGAAWLTAGGSKGGMTAIYHRRFYPDDVAGTIAYVAPESFAIPDPRYATFVDNVGTTSCRAAIRAYMTEMLTNRRAALLTRAMDDATKNNHAYTRIKIGPALESAIADFEWTFWQYSGIGQCGTIPAVTATDDDMWQVLDLFSPVGFSDDASTSQFEAYFYQAYAQLGSPGLASVRGDTQPSYLAGKLQFKEADYAGTLPLGVPVPTYDPAPMKDIDTWVRNEGVHLLFVYGEWDPWTGGKFAIGSAQDTLELVKAQGTHGSGIVGLAPADRDAALAKLQQWTGVVPMLPSNARLSEESFPTFARRPRLF